MPVTDTLPGLARHDPTRNRARPRLIGEAALTLALTWGYDQLQNVGTARRANAIAHADTLLTLERNLQLAPEHALNTAMSHAPLVLQYVANYYYASLNFVVTFGALAWLYLRRPDHYRRWRTSLVLVNLVALLVFWWYPVAPPRLLGDGFIDTVVAGHTVGSWGSQAATHADAYAAMPSLHVAWAVWSALALTHGLRSRTRHLLWAYPAATVLVVLATANHYLVDTIAGALTAGCAAALAPHLYRHGRKPDQRAGTDTDGELRQPARHI